MTSNKGYNFRIWSLTVIMIFLSILMVYTLISFWPIDGEETVHYFFYTTDVSYQNMLMIAILMTGGLGAMISTMMAFINDTGNQQLDNKGFIWYLMRPFLGMLLAIIFYFIVRGGFITGDFSQENINEFAFLAMAALAGMFANKATNKLKELFDNLLSTREKE